MSHFSVLVVADAEEELDDLLAPYREYDGMEDFPQEYLVWVRTEEQDRLEYESGYLAGYRLPDGSYVLAGDIPAREVRERGLEQVQVPFREAYPSLEAFMRRWHGRSYSPTEGWGYWTNPQGYWDWWVVGGRFSDVFSPGSQFFAGEVNWDMYAEKYGQQAMTYALLDKDGVWHHRPGLGWWDMRKDDDGTENYHSLWWRIVRSLPADQYLFVVDCHI
jgi:hypothetical protein